MNTFEKFVSHPESRQRTIQEWSGRNLDRSQWANGIVEIIGLEEAPEFETDAEAKMVFLYAVDYLWEQDLREPAEAWAMVSARVENLKTKMPFSFRDAADVTNGSNLSAPKVVKKRKETNEQKIVRWLTENKERIGEMKPKAMFAEIEEEFGITVNSIRGVYYSLKRKGNLPG